MQKIVELAKARWFVYPWSEIYGWLANSWDYGPYGSILKENIKFLWMKEFIQKRDDMMALDSAILMNPKVWVASWHVWGFSDPLIDDKNTWERFRADKLLEDRIEEVVKFFLKWSEDEFVEEKNNYQYRTTLLVVNIRNIFEKNPWLELNTIIKKEWKKLELEKKDWFNNQDCAKELTFLYFQNIYQVSNLVPESWSLEKQTDVMMWEAVKNPNTWNPWNWTDAKKFNLMFKTFQWVTEDSTATIYMRPETAQWIFVNFSNILRTSRRKLPFWVWQVWKAFRNEITPWNFIFRTREFEQMEIEYFCEPWKDLEEHAKWKEACENFLINVIWIKKESLRLRDHDQDELSHYSNATTDIEFKFPFGWWELWWIADRTDFDLKSHMRESKQDMSYFDPINNKKYIPYVIEPSVWLTRLTLATLCDAYTTETFENWETRTYFKFDPKVAPIKVWVLPVVKKLNDLWKQVYKQLVEDFICEYDDTGTIGKRYARFDEIWTPFCVTIDSENFDAWKVTVRFRDSMEQEVVELSELNDWLRKRMR